MSLVAASALTSFLTAAIGLGGGVALLAVMASLVPPAVLIPVHGVVQFGSNLGRAAVLRADIVWSVMTPFAVGAVFGIALGAGVAHLVPPNAVLVAVGLFIVWSVLGGRASSPGHGPIAGGTSSVLSMIVGASGPFVMSWVRGLGLERTGTVATHAALMVVQHGLKAVAFGVAGAALAPWAGIALAMVATGFLGTLAGRAVLLRLPEAAFRRALDVVLVLAALRLLWLGLDGLRRAV